MLARTLVVTVLLAGCGEADVSGTHHDAGVGSDAAMPGDGGVGTDATTGEDGGPGPGPDGGPGDPDAGPPGPALYPFDRRHSPIPTDLADGLRDVAPRGPDRA